MEVQPNAGAPLLRTEKARREWLESELALCNTSMLHQKVGASSITLCAMHFIPCVFNALHVDTRAVGSLLVSPR